MKVDVPSTAVRSGALLELGRCARHGVPATRSRLRRFTTEPPGIIVLLALFSCFLFFLLAAAFQKDVRGPLPECERCATTYRRRVTVLWVGVVGGPALLVLGAVLRNAYAALAGGLLLLAGVVVGVMADLARVRGTLDDDLAWVELRGVDAAFAAAASERVQAAPAPDPWVTPLR